MAGDEGTPGRDSALSVPKVYKHVGIAVPEELAAIHDLVDAARTNHPELSRRDLWLFETGLIEIANNIVEHGRPRGQLNWQVLLLVRPELLAAHLVENGGAYQLPRAVNMPATSAPGGRGLALAHATLDELTLSRIGEQNHWLIARRPKV